MRDAVAAKPENKCALPVQKKRNIIQKKLL